MSPEQKRRGGRRGLVVRLRRWLLGTAVVLLALLAGFIGYARHRARKALLDLPHLLGADIKSETNGFTYSQTVKGRTLFTIHASKAIQRNNGKITLHDVQVTLYGEPGSNRQDSIRGAEFEYDQPNGVVKAMGETQLDLASPVGSGEGKSPTTKRILVKATGLVLLEKLGVAATEGPIHFNYGTMSGDARGADYDADMGTLQLRHDVRLESHENGHTEQVEADSANLDRIARTVVLQQAMLRDATETLRARTLHVQLRPENAKEAGPIQEAHGEGGVQLTGADGLMVTAPAMSAVWGAESSPRTVRMTGGVQMHRPGEADGTAQEAMLTLNAQGRPASVTMLRNVRIASAAQLQGAMQQPSRVLTANKVVADLSAAAHPVLEQVIATGSARLVSTDAHSVERKKPVATTLTADTLHAFGNAAGKGWQVQRVEGTGASRIESTDGSGLVRTSGGDSLLALFQPDGAKRNQPGTDTFSASTLLSVVQQGHVVIEELRPATAATGSSPAKPAQKSRAVANRAEYIATTGKTVLTGTPQLNGDGFQIAGDTLTVDRTTGDAEAQGAVRGTYEPTQNTAKSKRGEPVHFLATKAFFARAGQNAVLYGGTSAARLWNSTGQIDAPVIELEQKTGRLFAHSAGDTAYAVRSVLPAGQAQSSSPHSETTASRNGLMRVASRSLVYTQGSAHEPGSAQFLGGVRVDGPAGQVIADTVVAELRSSAGGGIGLMSDAVQKIVAEGHVRVQQPGRSAMGERLQYTPADQLFVLTGTSGNPPSVRDSTRGLVTGARLIFHAGDDSVEVAGDAGQPVQNDVIVPARSGPVRTGGRSRPQAGKATGPK